MYLREACNRNAVKVFKELVPSNRKIVFTVYILFFFCVYMVYYTVDVLTTEFLVVRTFFAFANCIPCPDEIFSSPFNFGRKRKTVSLILSLVLTKLESLPKQKFVQYADKSQILGGRPSSILSFMG